MNWISQFDPFVKWNFILWQPYNNLDDKTFVDFLKARGLLIGADGYMQLKPLAQRESEIDSMVDTFNAHNVTLKGFFMFQPDTYTMNYAYSRYDFEFLVGYCFDQYVIDYMTMKGGWQLPYYHNSKHALKPAEDDKGLVVFPHVIWDWVSSLTHSHHLNTHIIGAYPNIYSDSSQAVNYCLKLINESLSSSEPFGYASAMFEWVWIINHQDFNDTATHYYRQITSQHGSICQLYNETTSWFKSHHTKTPTYHVTFTSPYDGQQVEWYLDSDYRIARMENRVKGYVIFENQTEYWLNHTGYVDFGKPASETNCIDNSLEFEIDDLDGGYDRDSPKGGSVYYVGNLADFPAFYNSSPALFVHTFKNDIPIASNITLLNENIAMIDAVNDVSSYKWLLPPKTYYVQASIFSKTHVYTSERFRVDLTEHTEFAINFQFGNLSISCIDTENRPLRDCAIIFTRQDEEYVGYTDDSGIATLEAYYDTWAVKIYKTSILVGETNVVVNQSKMDFKVKCNVGDVTVIVVDQYGESVEASVSLRNDEYDLTFSRYLHKSMENITFMQIPLINYTLTIDDAYETQIYSVDTIKTRQIRTMHTSVTEVVGISWFEIIICILIGTFVGSITVWMLIRKEVRITVR